MRRHFSHEGLKAACLALIVLLAGCSDGANEPLFDFYVLSLSWSPSYCALEGDRAQAEQCDRDEPAGFVVHGLWPQFESGYPEFCPAGQAQSPSRNDLEQARKILPSAALARHQWRKHGSCTGLAPGEYFAAMREASRHVRIPGALQITDQDHRLTPAAAERAFIGANAGLTHDAIAITCAARMLREVRICMSRDFSFRSCPEVDRRGCRSGTLLLPASVP